MESHRWEMEAVMRPLRKITELDDSLEEDYPVPLPPPPWRVYLVFICRHLMHSLLLTKLHVWVACRWPELLRRYSSVPLFLAFCLLSMAFEAMVSKQSSSKYSRRS
jgi:hypothetical protein